MAELEQENEIIKKLEKALIAVGFPAEEARNQTDNLLGLIGAKADIFLKGFVDPKSGLSTGSEEQDEEIVLENLKNIANTTIQDYVRNIFDGLPEELIAKFKEVFDS